MDNQCVLVTVSGPDRPGITASLMQVIKNSDHQLVDMGQSVTHGFLSLSFLLEPKGSNPQQSAILKDLLFNAKKMGLSLDFDAINSQEILSSGVKSILSCVSPDTIGADFIGEMAQLLAQHQVNILRIDNTSAEGFNSLEMKTNSTAQVDWKRLKGELVQVSQLFKVDMAFMKENIFRTSKRLIVFDMDATLIQTEVINELAKVHGVEEEVSRITHQSMNGELDFGQSLKKRVGLLQGLGQDCLQEVAEGLPITPGVPEFLKTVRSKGFKVAVISGGFQYFANYLKEKLELDYAFANQLDFDGQGKLTGKLSGNIIDSEQKAFLMDLLAQQENISLEQVVAIGDGANDIPMLTKAGLGIAFHAKKVVRDKTNFHMSHGPMTSILSFLGISPEV